MTPENLPSITQELEKRGCGERLFGKIILGISGVTDILSEKKREFNRNNFPRRAEIPDVANKNVKKDTLDVIRHGIVETSLGWDYSDSKVGQLSVINHSAIIISVNINSGTISIQGEGLQEIEREKWESREGYQILNDAIGEAMLKPCHFSWPPRSIGQRT